MKLSDLLNINELKKLVDAGYINVTKHPVFDLYIYNYSKECQFAKYWNYITETCRGLIVNGSGEIVSRPFRKFYNYEELVLDNKQIPNESFEVYEKLDGSLGILYWGDDNKPYIATRGSFTSQQAIHASKLIENYDCSNIDKSKTYLFEIIYPEDLHVVSYSGIDDIFLLAIIDNETATEENIYNQSIFKTTRKYDGISDYNKIRDMFSGENKEGFVIKFESGFRMKLKFKEYWKLHFLKAGFTEKNIFGYIASGDNNSIDEAMKMFDEEHTIYYQKIIDRIYNCYNEILETCKLEFRNNFSSRKEMAEYFNTCSYPSVLFLMSDNKEYTETIWREVARKLYGWKWNLKVYLANKKDMFYSEDIKYLD